LANVGGEGDHFAVVLVLQPFEDDGGVQTARVGENNSLWGRVLSGGRPCCGFTTWSSNRWLIGKGGDSRPWSPDEKSRLLEQRLVIGEALEALPVQSPRGTPNLGSGAGGVPSCCWKSAGVICRRTVGPGSWGICTLYCLPA
jgi:hypothetical protein